MAIDKDLLKTVSQVYPLRVEEYEQYMPDVQNPNVVEKVNAMIQALNKMGRMTNKAVGNWNQIMKWILDEGIEDITTAVAIKKIEEMLDTGVFDVLIQNAINLMHADLQLAIDGFSVRIGETETKANNVLVKQTDFEAVVNQKFEEYDLGNATDGESQTVYRNGVTTKLGEIDETLTAHELSIGENSQAVIDIDGEVSTLTETVNGVVVTQGQASQTLAENVAEIQTMGVDLEGVKQFKDNSLFPETLVASITSTNVHQPTMIVTPTYDGSGVTVHPDVIYIPNGFGSKKWRYWMAHTPMPNRDDRFENPSIIASHDGINFENPNATMNPVIPAPPAGNDHNSDACIEYYNGTLYMWYRESKRSLVPRETRIYLTKSTNGEVWTTPVAVLSNLTGVADSLMSPTVRFRNNRFEMWMVDGFGNLVKRTSLDGVTWTPNVTCTITGMPAGRAIWHLQITESDGKLHMLLNNGVIGGGTDNQLQYAYSTDQGLSWTTSAPFIKSHYSFESQRFYRGAMRAIDGLPNVFEIWYTAMGIKDEYRVAYMNAIVINNRMYPLTASDMKYVTFQAISTPSVRAGSIATQFLSVAGIDVGKKLDETKPVAITGFQNLWTPHAVMFPQYYKDGKRVYLEGRVEKGNTSANGMLMFTLPEGFRPKRVLIFRQVYGDVHIDVTGTVTIYRFDVAGTYVSLEGISFLTN